MAFPGAKKAILALLGFISSLIAVFFSKPTFC